MADISISKSRGKKYLGGFSPMVPAFIVGDDPIPLNPPGSNTSHSPVTIGSPANGLSLVGQELSLGIGAGLGIDGINRIQFGKVEPTDDIFNYVDLSEYDSSSPIDNKLIFTTSWDNYWNATSNIYNYISLSKDSIISTISEENYFLSSILEKVINGVFYNSRASNNSNYVDYLLSALDSQLDINISKNIDSNIQSLRFEPVLNKIILEDSINFKGLENAGDYEANFTARSLVTKQYVTSAISGAGHNPVTISGTPNGLSISGTQVLSLGLSSAGVTGALSGTDWSTFNGKLNLTSPITGYVIGANTALADTDTILGAFGKIQGQIGARVSGTIASGQVAFGTGVNTVGGSNNLFWHNTNGRLGIGITTPISLLSLGSSISNTKLALFDNGTNIYGFGVQSLQFRFHTDGSSSSRFSFLNGSAGTEVFTIRGTTARVGINNLNPDTNLHVTSSGTVSEFRINNTSGTNVTANFGTTSAGVTFLGSVSNHAIFFQTNSVERARFLATGEFGVNTTAPTNTLDVNGTTRIRTIANAVGNFLTTSATGVVQQRTAGESASDIGAVTITGTQTITGAKTFDNSLLVLSGTSPIFRIAGNGNVSTLNFRANNTEEKATLEFNDLTKTFTVKTNVSNADIAITPHGTGKIKLSNVPSGSGTVLAIDGSNNLVKSSALSAYKLLDEDITPTGFTSTTYATLLTGGILGTNSFDGAVDASYEGEIVLKSISAGSYNFDLRFVLFGQNIDLLIAIGAITIDLLHLIKFKLIIQGGNFLITGTTFFAYSNFYSGTAINPSITTYASSGTSAIDLQAKVSGTGTPTLSMVSFKLKQIL